MSKRIEQAVKQTNSNQPAMEKSPLIFDFDFDFHHLNLVKQQEL
jgi:hypothetical protein